MVGLFTRVRRREVLGSPGAACRMGFDALCQHLEFEAMDRIVLPGQQPPAGHLHDHYGTLATPDATLSQMRQSTSACNSRLRLIG